MMRNLREHYGEENKRIFQPRTGSGINDWPERPIKYRRAEKYTYFPK